VALDGGFLAYSRVDPMIIADVTCSGAVSALDAQRIAQESVGLDPPEIPPLPQPLRLDGPPAVGRDVTRLSDAQLDSIVQTAVARIESSRPETQADLRGVSFEIVDLSGDILGMTNGRTVQVDTDAAGNGWFVDVTPEDDVEFDQPDGTCVLTALPGSPAVDRVDLLTVIMHELGHVLGYDHSGGAVMEASLATGTRRVWDNETLLDDLDDPAGFLEGPGCFVPAVDGYFATK
jgi:hypothetical protein